MNDSTEVKQGLNGVVVDYTAISRIDPATNSLLYRGYPVEELAGHVDFEAVAYLLWHGELPSAAELARFTATERSRRALDANVKRVIDDLPTDTHPMDVLRTAVSVIGANDTDAWASDPEAILDKGLTLFAKLPAIVAYDQRHRHQLPPVPPRDDLDYAANFLCMTFGEEPEEVIRQAFATSLVLYAEHSFNASTFTARVITSTLSDYYSAIVGAIGALKGPLHGGANEAVLHTFDEIGAAENVPTWLADALDHKRKVMGFGHRVYKNGDSRVPTMQAALDALVEHYRRPEVRDLYAALKDGMQDRTNLKPNLDYPSGPVYHLIGFDTEEFTPLFVAARMTGWTAHILEQRAANHLIRPLASYTGLDERHVA
ncbi:MAG TPA: bifunctional 2-methylcitrate synthase/citrate synthase [Segeticoccus sp.]|uniref:bifunctional 2-methylcitrate synthase/citrate synthase n=1 Tax=Segeticoccus sp. TaxID=2706531 RepID=UPI002D7ED3D5|nr:bifunctional 2-methylcitrate synthase/citrate synthase [Segeticoccus sp.]HET8602123.1 bifunctional 2-methylcitrate synthase/citrate synthase [Segeticoccus sp.]